jgi:hypothetical protein
MAAEGSSLIELVVDQEALSVRTSLSKLRQTSLARQKANS